ncbi:MAG: DUF624 domain-containing protein [Clostridia bacterium]|nr:DUF624 domain-containing protein [Oscillospiraceae bacterium]MBQ7032598.1 DUF624 domain-containing protein [Clostridia bacterium]
MGFFTFNFDKPGRGVDKDAPQKRGFFLFFDVLLRKFWRICSLSLGYTLLSVPAAIVYLFLNIFLQGAFSPIKDPAFITYMGIYIMLFLVCFLGSGPASAGQAYVLRNFSREDHAWVWDDFWSQTKENFGKGLAMFLLDIVIVTLLISSAVLYLNSGFLPLPPMISAVFGFLAIIALIIWFMMHFFFYPLLVTLDMKFGQLLKTSFQLTMAKLPQCILIFVLSIAVFAILMALYFVNIAFVLLFAALGFSLVSFVYIFFATSVMDGIINTDF